MVILMVALTFAVAIAVDALVIKRLAESRAKEMVVERFEQKETIPYYKEKKDVLYHEGHTWARVRQAVMDIGLDQFTKDFTGEITKIELPEPGAKLQRGKKAWTIHFGDRTLTQLAPVSGTIVEVNKRLLDDPKTIGHMDYQDDWLVSVLPEALSDEIPALYTAPRFAKWIDLQKAWLARQSYPDLGVVVGDGEQLLPGAAMQIDSDDWEVVARKLFGFEV